MDERYFLYFEDLDWGMRAQRAGGVGYANGSIVRHAGGTTIGSASRRAARSKLAVDPDFSKPADFRRDATIPSFWLGWTAIMVLPRRRLNSSAVGSWRNFRAALSGIMAGLVGETGRPDHVFEWLSERPGLGEGAR